MREFEIRSAIDLLVCLKDHEPFAMFRGQACADWPLVPAMGRLHECVKRYESWHALEYDLLERFQKYARAFLDKEPVSKLEWLVVAQHYGLPTRLLDWTTNPLKALFFSVENPCNREDGILWALQPKGWRNELRDVDARLDRDGILVAYFPDHLNQRVSNQESCFTLFPFPDEKVPLPGLDQGDAYNQHIKTLTKFLIPFDCKNAIRMELRTLGINHRSMFPGLDGLAKSIRREIGLEW
jgi:hypothetical protein